eukprot:jgi/Mesvir1/8369/Mv12620-RA.1
MTRRMPMSVLLVIVKADPARLRRRDCSLGAAGVMATLDPSLQRKDAGLLSAKNTVDNNVVLATPTFTSAPAGMEGAHGAAHKNSKLSRARKSFYHRFIKRKPVPKVDPISTFPLMSESGSPWPSAFAEATELAQPVDQDLATIKIYIREHPEEKEVVSSLVHSLAVFLKETSSGAKDMLLFARYLALITHPAGAEPLEGPQKEKENEAALESRGQGAGANEAVTVQVATQEQLQQDMQERGQEGAQEETITDSLVSPKESQDLFGSPTSIRLRSMPDEVAQVVVEAVPPPPVVASPLEPPAMDIIEEFQRNFASFKQEMFLRNTTLMKELSVRQTPKVMVIGCCDSRTSATMVMRAAPGQLFTVRNVANLVPTYERGGTYHGTSAALEYAVNHLKVEHIIVMGHRSCGGIRALMSREPDEPSTTDFIDSWVQIAWPARQQTKAICGDLSFDKQCRYCEKESINVSLANLLTFPFIKQAVNSNQLFLHGMYYDLSEGTLHRWRLVYKITDYEKWT